MSTPTRSQIYWATYGQARYKRLKEAGICTACAKEPAKETSRLCLGCSEKDKSSKENWNRKNSQPRKELKARIERRLRHRYRTQVLTAYGNLCACCGESEPRFLELDHVNNDGWEHRKKVGGVSRGVYKWAIDNNFPDTLQILCSNCNHGKARNGGICPHKDLA